MAAAEPRDSGDLLQRLIKLREELAGHDESAAQYKDLIAQAEKKQRAATAKTTQQGQALAQLEKAAKRLGAGGGGGGSGGSGGAEGAADAVQREVASQLEQCRGALERVRSIKPDTGSLFVRLFLGKVNVRVAGMQDRHTLRDEYEKFRFRTNFGFIIFPLVWILDYLYLRNVWKHTHWINILTHVWLLYYYVSLALRSNILKVNATKVKSWWINHHYVSAFMSIVVLTWPPESRSFDSNTPFFTAYFLYQGLVQFLQSRYQSERHYARKAMGEKHDMDVAQTETIDEFHSGFWLLVGLLFTAYACQLGLGGMLWYNLLTHLNVSQPWYSFREEMQCALLGTCFLLLGTMNCWVTASTVLEKRAKEGRHAAQAAALGGGALGGAAAAAAAGAPAATEAAAAAAATEAAGAAAAGAAAGAGAGEGAGAGAGQQAAEACSGSAGQQAAAAAAVGEAAGGAGGAEGEAGAPANAGLRQRRGGEGETG